ncbi:hypothetical protein ARMGADRAFT_1030529 [Armillaria gallica]|uniref:Uncharacterized protein n=1 Tax=Armillaria gallica TaxID=47427 RepID=A0A2H3DD27_ARMGA|nr:hypothetical protein ARMGADRAFT_1030529 [Armillaria gallica]
MTFPSDSSCADVRVPRDRTIHLCERLKAYQTRNGKLQLLIEDNLNRDYEMGMQRDIDGRGLLGRSDAERDVTVRGGHLATSLSFPCAPLTTVIHDECLLPRQQRAATNSVSRRRRVVFAALHGDRRHDKWSLEKISKTAERDDVSRDWRADTGKSFCSVKTMIRTKLSSCGELDLLRRTAKKNEKNADTERRTRYSWLTRNINVKGNQETVVPSRLPRKVDPQLESGEYFLKHREKKAREIEYFHLDEKEETHINCEKVPDGSKNIIPRSSNDFTYLFTPRETIITLFSSFGLDRLAFSLYQEDNMTAVLQLNDTLPSTVDVNGTAFAAHFYDNDIAHTLKSNPVTMGEEAKTMSSMKMGRKHVETYSSTTGVPSSTGIISQNKEIMDSSAEEKRTGNAMTGSNVNRQLNSTKLYRSTPRAERRLRLRVFSYLIPMDEDTPPRARHYVHSSGDPY